MTQPGAVTVTRFHSGSLLHCGLLEVRLVPRLDGSISVLPIARRVDRSFTLSDGESRTDYLPDEINLEGELLRCQRRPIADVPQYAEGFTLALPWGLAAALRRELPQLRRVARGAAALQGQVAVLMGDRPWAHQGDFVVNVVARLVLDGLDLDGAIALEGQLHFAGKDEHWMALFSDAGIRRLLSAAAS